MGEFQHFHEHKISTEDIVARTEELAQVRDRLATLLENRKLLKKIPLEVKNAPEIAEKMAEIEKEIRENEQKEAKLLDKMY